MTEASPLLLRSAAVDGTIVDVAVADGRVAAIGPSLVAAPATEVVDLDGRALLPGLWDAHVHFDQWTLARRRVDLAPARSAADAAALVGDRLRHAPPTPGTTLVGYGFRDAPGRRPAPGPAGRRHGPGARRPRRRGPALLLAELSRSREPRPRRPPDRAGPRAGLGAGDGGHARGAHATS